jgi:hypothetical protein
VPIVSTDDSDVKQNLALENEILNLNSVRKEMVEKEEVFRLQQEAAMANEKVT